MIKGLGKALQDALTGKEDSQQIAPAPSPLLNAHRRRIFEYLCLRPFSTSGRIASELKLSSSSVAWHLRSLVATGYVVHRPDVRIYYPKDLVDFGDASIFMALQRPRRREVFRQVMDTPGISQVEMAEAMNASRQTAGKVAAELEHLGLLTKVSDGRFVRWYSTNMLTEKQDAHRSRSRAYVEWFLRRMEDEGQSPQVLRRTETELQLRMGKGRGRGVLSVPLDPYGALVG